MRHANISAETLRVIDSDARCRYNFSKDDEVYL